MSAKEDIKVAFDEEDAVEAVEYTGQIVRSEFGTEWANGEQFSDSEQLRMEIEADEYDKSQFAWIAPSQRKGTKWLIFVEAMKKIGAWKDVELNGSTNREKLESLANSLTGMKLTIQKHDNYPSPFGSGIVKGVIIPIKYHGKSAVSTTRKASSTEKVSL